MEGHPYTVITVGPDGPSEEYPSEQMTTIIFENIEAGRELWDFQAHGDKLTAVFKDGDALQDLKEQQD